MIDKKLEENIKKTKHFIDLWSSFRGIFSVSTSDVRVRRDKEEEFLSTKPLVTSRYEDLMDSLGAKPLKRFIVTPYIYNVLSLEELSMMSDKRINEVRKDWEESNKFLKALLSRLERKKRRIEGFNKFYLSFKRKFKKERN